MGVADPDLQPVDLLDRPGGAPHPEGALPAGQSEGLGEFEPVTGRLRPDGQLGPGPAEHLTGGMQEERLGVRVPGPDQAVLADLDDADPDGARGVGQFAAGQARQRVPGAGHVRGQQQPEPDGLLPGGVLDTPGGRERGAHQQAAAALAVRVGIPVRGGGGDVCERGQAALGVAVRHLDPDALLIAQAADLGGRSRVHDGVRDQLADQHDRVVDDLGQAPAQQRVADESARGGGRSADRLEGGGCARGDHVPLLPSGRRLCPVPGGGRPGCPRPGTGTEERLGRGAAFHPTFRLVSRGARAVKQAPAGDSGHDSC